MVIKRLFNIFKAITLPLLLALGANNASLYGQEVFDLQGKTVILAPLNDTLCQQSVYVEEALKKSKFSNKYLHRHNIYGTPIHIDSVYIINPESQKKRAVVIKLTHNRNRVVYHVPLYFKRTSKIKSFMWHTIGESLLSNSYDDIPKTIEDVNVNDITIPYYDLNEISRFASVYKDSMVILNMNYFHGNMGTFKEGKVSLPYYKSDIMNYTFRGFKFIHNQYTRFQYLHAIFEPKTNGRTQYVAIRPSNINDYNYPNISMLKDGIGVTKTLLDVLRDSCAATYNQKALMSFTEKFTGKEVWLVSNLHNASRYWKMNDSVSDHHKWLTESSNMAGTSKQSFMSGFLGGPNYISGVKCKCDGVRLLLNLGNKTKWAPVKDGYRNEGIMNPLYRRFEAEHDHETSVRIYGNQYKGQWVENAQNPRKGPVQLLYKYYAVFTVCPDLTYKIGGWPVCDNSIADTLFVAYNDDLNNLVMLDDEFQQAYKQHEERDKEQWNIYNFQEQARYNYYVQEWGERIADKVKRGLVEFGFSSEMCTEAHREEPYRVDKAMTPFGLATRYDFYLSQLRLYFIDDQLIGIETKGKRPRYYM